METKGIRSMRKPRPLLCMLTKTKTVAPLVGVYSRLQDCYTAASFWLYHHRFGERGVLIVKKHHQIVVQLLLTALVACASPRADVEGEKKTDGGVLFDTGVVSDRAFAAELNNGREDAFAADAAQPDTTVFADAVFDSVRPDTARPDTARPDTARPDASRPDTARPDTARPDTSRPDTTGPDTFRPDKPIPDTIRPDTSRPDTSRPDTNPPPQNFVSIRVWPEAVGVFKDLGSQQFQAFGERSNGTELDITQQVDWYVEDFPFAGQTLSGQQVASIDSSGLATVQNTTWGRANIAACYPRGCHSSSALNTASTSLTVLTIGVWERPTLASPPAVVNYTVTEYMSNVRIYSNRICWDIDPGTSFTDNSLDPNIYQIGSWARLWAFYSDDNYLTWTANAWDYVDNADDCKYNTGYGTGHHWIGQMISTVCDQPGGNPPNACNGRKRSNIFFIPH